MVLTGTPSLDHTRECGPRAVAIFEMARAIRKTYPTNPPVDGIAEGRKNIWTLISFRVCHVKVGNSSPPSAVYATVYCHQWCSDVAYFILKFPQVICTIRPRSPSPTRVTTFPIFSLSPGSPFAPFYPRSPCGPFGPGTPWTQVVNSTTPFWGLTMQALLPPEWERTWLVQHRMRAAKSITCPYSSVYSHQGELF